MLEPHEERLFSEFMKSVKARLEVGREQYGKDYLKKDLIKEIEYEMLDLAGYAFLLFIKVGRLRDDYGRATGQKRLGNFRKKS